MSSKRWSFQSQAAFFVALLLECVLLSSFFHFAASDNPNNGSGFNSQFDSNSTNASTAGATTTESLVDEEEELHEFDALTVLVICASLFAAMAAGYGLHKYKFNYLPHSTAAMLIGVVVGGVASAVQVENATLNELEVLTFSSEFFFYVLLPPIIFDAGYHFEKKRFFRNFSTILLFAIIGTILSTFVVGFTVYGFAAAGVIENVDATSPLEALMFGSLISAVDPVATLSIMGNPELNCDPTLYSIVFGESVINDAVSIVLFSSFKNFLSVELTTASIFLVLAEFVGIAVGSALIGCAMGLICSLIFKNSSLNKLPAYETLILFILAYGAFAVGEACKMSGVMSLFFCGIILSHYNYYNLSDAARVSSKTLFHSVALASETFVFMYMGMCLFTGEFTTWDGAFCVIAVIACLLGRFINTFGLSLLINACSRCKKKKNKLSCKMQFIIWFAGLRGAIAFALAFTMPDSTEVEGWNREAMVTTTLVVVFFTTIVIGGLTEPVIKKVRVEAADEDVAEFMPQNTGFSHMDLEFPATPSSSRQLTKGGMHKLWKAFDEKHMKRVFGGPKDESSSLMAQDNMGELTPKATTFGEEDVRTKVTSVDLDEITEHPTGYTPPVSPDDMRGQRLKSNSYANNRQIEANGDESRLSDDDDGGVGSGDNILELDGSDL